MKKIYPLVLLLVFFGLAGSAHADGSVFVSIEPQAYFVEKIAGDRFDVSVMVKPGASPATYEPRPSQMRKLSRTRAYFTIGVPFESAWMDRIRAANPDIVLIRTEDGIARRPIDGCEAASGITDPHIWLSPPLVMLQARNILDGLCRIDPGGTPFFEKNYKAFIEELVDLDLEIRGVLSGAEREFMVYHPAWGYFADTYGLNQVAVQTGGRNPGPSELVKLVKYAKENNIRVVFVQPQFSTRNASVIADAIAGKVKAADPLSARWRANLLDVARTFAGEVR